MSAAKNSSSVATEPGLPKPSDPDFVPRAEWMQQTSAPTFFHSLFAPTPSTAPIRSLLTAQCHVISDISQRAPAAKCHVLRDIASVEVRS